MNDIAIHVEHLSKEYHLGVIGHGSLRKDIQSIWARLRGRDDPNSKLGAEPGGERKNGSTKFLALDDVSFQLRQGESLGIVGANGAGKSTLLKILSRIVTPDRGCVRIRGRVSSLLEVGTGFHPDMTGRENIFMNGYILGMRRRDILSRVDEIIAFSEIERFIDTPVKRYSSGMRVRLAFSVAAHMLAETVILDEVLAVGDLAFQEKSLRKMESLLKHEGRTLLFVSHSSGALLKLCQRGLLLEKGAVVMDSSIQEVVEHYERPILSKHAA